MIDEALGVSLVTFPRCKVGAGSQRKEDSGLGGFSAACPKFGVCFWLPHKDSTFKGGYTG